jgi:hypothetical protein
MRSALLWGGLTSRISIFEEEQASARNRASLAAGGGGSGSGAYTGRTDATSGSPRLGAAIGAVVALGRMASSRRTESRLVPPENAPPRGTVIVDTPLSPRMAEAQGVSPRSGAPSLFAAAVNVMTGAAGKSSLSAVAGLLSSRAALASGRRSPRAPVLTAEEEEEAARAREVRSWVVFAVLLDSGRRVAGPAALHSAILPPLWPQVRRFLAPDGMDDEERRLEAISMERQLTARGEYGGADVWV